MAKTTSRSTAGSAKRATTRHCNGEASHHQDRRQALRRHGGGEGGKGDARNEARHVALRKLGQESHQPQAGRCHRAERSASRRRQGSARSVTGEAGLGGPIWLMP